MDNPLVLFDRYYNKQIRIVCYASFILRVHGNTFEHPSWFYTQSAPFLFFGIMCQHLMWGRLLNSQGFCIAFYRHYWRKNFPTIIPPEPSYNTSISLEQCLLCTLASSREFIIFKQSPLQTPNNYLLSIFVATVGGWEIILVMALLPLVLAFFAFGISCGGEFPPSKTYAFDITLIILCRNTLLLLSSNERPTTLFTGKSVTLLHLEILPPLASAYLFNHSS